MMVKIPADKNASVAEFEKLSKYKDLKNEVEAIALSMIKKSIEKISRNAKNTTYRHRSCSKKNLVM